MSVGDFLDAEACMSRSPGHCMTMGTASTMAVMVEALGMGMPGNAAIPAVDSRRMVLAQLAGRRIVDMVRDDVVMSQILTRQTFENAIRVNGAIGGSTNAVIHLLAIAGRVGVPVDLDDWDRLGRDVPTIVDLMPSGRFLMEEFYYAGGLPVVHARARRGRPAPPRRADRQRQDDLARPARRRRTTTRRSSGRCDKPLTAEGGIVVLARQPRAGRRGDQAVGGDARADAASRPRRRLREHRGLQCPHRRSGARHRRDLRHGAEELRPARLSRHGRGRQHGPAAEAPQDGHHRHGAHLGRAHERHRLRHGRPARRAGGGARRPARGGARTAT